ncbi:hypothetical protein [Eubacterium coprostanoligenes]|uniref:hypothetical protein n=1 Tax=Eubacterium coprostanoligenes TaxID=290054 RepID=UPI002355B4D2|nr:hypothetical protein [Eubacterium coprostanoligenes]MCI6253954.1 hypothetical protein [Eubacterium coprostanoligenes]MDY5399923.1 hypothetical protein [Eubacterium coprostanoligenes]
MKKPVTDKTIAVIFKVIAGLLVLISLSNVFVGINSFFGIFSSLNCMLPSVLGSLLLLVIMLSRTSSPRLISAPFFFIGFADLVIFAYFAIIRADVGDDWMVACAMKIAALIVCGFISQGCFQNNKKIRYCLFLPVLPAVYQSMAVINKHDEIFAYDFEAYKDLSHILMVMDGGEYLVILAVALFTFSQTDLSRLAQSINNVSAKRQAKDRAIVIPCLTWQKNSSLDISQEKITNKASFAASLVFFAISIIMQFVIALVFVLENWFDIGKEFGFDYVIYGGTSSTLTVFMILLIGVELGLCIYYAIKASQRTFMLRDITAYFIYALVSHFLLGMIIVETLGDIGEGLFEKLGGFGVYFFFAPIFLMLFIALLSFAQRGPVFDANGNVVYRQEYRAVMFVLSVLLFLAVGIAISVSGVTCYDFDYAFVDMFGWKSAPIYLYGESGKPIFYDSIFNAIVIIKYIALGLGVGCAIKSANRNNFKIGGKYGKKVRTR